MKERRKMMRKHGKEGDGLKGFRGIVRGEIMAG
jgi:chlorite dismutase